MLGHFWTIAPHLLSDVRERVSPGPQFHQSWSTAGVDLGRGPAALDGRWQPVPDADTAVVLLHGLGGSPESGYLLRLARELAGGGMSVLRPGLRGSGQGHQDLYNAMIHEDLSSALASEELDAYKRIVVIGFSLGGHIALRWAMRPSDSRVKAVCAVCPPLDLAACARHIDSPRQSVYRRHILKSLRAMHARIDAQNPLPTPTALKEIRTLGQWDEHVVVPRFGFGTAQDYYAIASAGPRLGDLAVPTLIVEATNDPMIPAESAEKFLRAGGPKLTVRRTNKGGHVSFPPWLDLGYAGGPGIGTQLLGWIRSLA